MGPNFMHGAPMGHMGPMVPMGGPMMGPNGPMGPMMGPISGMSPMMGGPMGPMGPRCSGPMMRGPMVPDIYGGPMGPCGPQMMGYPNKPGQCLPPGGPDSAQPLPPSMGGQSYKSGGGNVPGGNGGAGGFASPAQDPNYAAQFHNFQQQLYATNTQRGHMPPHPHMGPHPHQMMGHQGPAFYAPK